MPDFRLSRPSISRVVLPVLAIAGIIVALILVLGSQPDRSLANPETTPASTPDSLRRGGGAVAGAGVVEPSSELIEIGSHVAGIVDRVHVQPGDQVSAGQPLFTIDERATRAQLAEAEAQVRSLESQLAAARTTLAVAEQQYGLYRNVTDNRAVSQQEVIERRGAVDQARTQLDVARAQLDAARAQLASARTSLALRTVRAPVAAEVLQVKTRAGEFATAGPPPGGNADPLMTLGVTRPLHVRLDIDENEIERVDLGKPAIISPRGDAGVRVPASFVRAEPLVVPKRSLTNSASERVDVRVLQLIYALPEKGHRMFVGQQVDGFVPARKDAAK